jgi:ribose-phosphate pyrophosphokinase
MILLNGKEIVPTVFPDGCPQVWKIDLTNEERCSVIWLFRDLIEFFSVAQLIDLLAWQNKMVTLLVTYLPFARQDKPVNNDSTFGLGTFVGLMRTLPLKRLIIYHPHSVLYGNREVLEFNEHYLENKNIIFIDKGAAQRYNKLIQTKPHIILDKFREQSTGIITSFKIEIDNRDHSLPYIIIDDLCDGGASFISALEYLEISEADLYTAHGIYSKGVEVLKSAGFNKIICHRTLDKQYPDGIIIEGIDYDKLIASN